MGMMKEFDIRIRSGGDDAIAAVNELMAGRWTSVEDELPRGRCFCLVALRVGDEPTKRHVRFAHFDPERACRGGHLFVDEEIEYSVHSVTHWMPLPDPPQLKARRPRVPP